MDQEQSKIEKIEMTYPKTYFSENVKYQVKDEEANKAQNSKCI